MIIIIIIIIIITYHHPHDHHYHHHYHHLGKPVVIATQMMESMIENPTPTRAEASDCATAIYDSSDAVMLSAESAAGKYPIESVLMQQQIINRVETDEVFRTGLDRFAKEFDVLQSKDSTTLAITLAARQVGIILIMMMNMMMLMVKM